jgi:site-specific DNA recombinase
MAVKRTGKAGQGKRVGGYVRISEDPNDEEKGVTRQAEDVRDLAASLGWQVTKLYEENDTSAYKKRHIRLPNGRSVWRVIRPKFRQMLQDYEDGIIDAIIVYDIDRLARQPRDLEDLIDLVEHFKRPVIGATGNLDLMTDHGKAMARILVTMANKSSGDTARRVAREKLQTAREGNSRPGTRAFGWKADRVTLDPKESALVRKAARLFIAGESWSSVTKFIADSGIPTVMNGKWRIRTVKNIVLSPRIAGIALYNGQMRPDREGGSTGVDFLDMKARALIDEKGDYVQGKWEPILPVEEWEQAISEQLRRTEGTEFTSSNTRAHLLSGLLRCGRILDDGTTCNLVMNGTRAKQRTGKYTAIYKCPGKVHGGCGRNQRNMGKLDLLIEDLFFLHLEKNAPVDEGTAPEQDPYDPIVEKLEDVRSRLVKMRTGMRDGKVSPESFFAVVPGLEQQERKLLASLSKAKNAKKIRDKKLRSPGEVKQEWQQAVNNSARRALLGQYLQAIVVEPSQTRGTVFDWETIKPIWKNADQ